jgi:uncharacterized protein (TIGR03083 family)
MTEQHAPSYEALRVRVTEIVRDTEPELLEGPAPATPEWRVRDVLAHLSGVADDVVNGRVQGIASDEWTAAQVEKRRDLSIDDLLADWERWSPAFEQMLAAGPLEITGQALYDAVTHEHDIRHAIGRPGARDSDALEQGWEWQVAVRTVRGAPAIRFVTERGEQIAGAGTPAVTVQASCFELVRATTGRRTRKEIEAYAWEPEPDPPMLIAAPFFTIRTESLGE